MLGASSFVGGNLTSVNSGSILYVNVNNYGVLQFSPQHISTGSFVLDYGAVLNNEGTFQVNASRTVRINTINTASTFNNNNLLEQSNTQM